MSELTSSTVAAELWHLDARYFFSHRTFSSIEEIQPVGATSCRLLHQEQRCQVPVAKSCAVDRATFNCVCIQHSITTRSHRIRTFTETTPTTSTVPTFHFHKHDEPNFPRPLFRHPMPFSQHPPPCQRQRVWPAREGGSRRHFQRHGA